MDPLLGNIFTIVVLIFSAVIHEVAHGAVAGSMGDPTAKFAGRLTLNPISHLDLFGSLILPFILIMTAGVGFAYAKPVPVNPFNFRDQKFGMIMVALAGIAANIGLALIFGLMLRALLYSSVIVSPDFNNFLAIVVGVNLWLALFNLMPIPPLDGSHVLLALLPKSQNDFKVFLQQYGIIFFVIFIFYFSHILAPVVNFLGGLIIGAPL